MIGVRDLRGIPLPTPAQQTAFVEHVCYAHSWYKHIPLDVGAEFVVFLSAEGERFARGVSREDYRRDCGHLAYAWRIADERFRIDFAADDVDIALELRQAGGVTLFPYCSNDAAACECLLSLYGDDLPATPQREGMLALFRAEREVDRLWSALPQEAREAAVAERHDVRLADYARAEANRTEIYDALRLVETRKLGGAISRIIAIAT